MPGMDVRAALTVVGDGPVGAVGRQLDTSSACPTATISANGRVGMKMVVDLPDALRTRARHGVPHLRLPGARDLRLSLRASGPRRHCGIFVPSWFRSPMRTSYRYLQHYMLHPYLWRYLQGGKLRPWGAKSLQESGRRGEPFLAGDGYARIGEGSGSTNVLTGSGVDEAWTTGAQLAEAVLELHQQGKPFTKENLEQTYVARRRASWVEEEGRIAEKARDGFHRGIITGLHGHGDRRLHGRPLLDQRRAAAHARSAAILPREIPRPELDRILEDCRTKGLGCHDALMDRCGWPAIPFDGQLLVSHQDALLMGGKVQAPPGFADHVRFVYPDFCERCASKMCIEMCSGQALIPGPTGVPAFDREKCVHCGACLWNCATPLEDDPQRTNITFKAGAGGLHSGEN